MSDPAPSASESTHGVRNTLFQKFCFLVGAVGVITAMVTDATAVAGRHLGLPLIGAIEVVQAAIVLLATSAMVITTQKRGHASIHIVIDRVDSRKKLLLGRVAAAVSAFYCALLFAGCCWVFWETWPGHERSELLAINYRWLRLAAVVCSGTMTVYFCQQALASRKE